MTPSKPTEQTQRPGAPHARHLLLRTEDFFARRSPAFVVAVGLLTIGAIFGIDLATGPAVSLQLLYLIPVGLVTWHRGRWAGAVTGFVSTAALFAAELAGGLVSAGSGVPYWNAAARFGVFLVVTGLLSTLREALEAQRAVARHEHAAAEQQVALNEFKNTLLHAVSHDLKGPLTAVIGSAQILDRAEQLSLTPEQRTELLRAISVSARKMNRLITDLLDLERVDRGMAEPDREPTDVGAVARRVVAEADFLYQHPALVEADPFLLMLDAGKVERIVENLLVNAAKHTTEGTPVMVRVEPSDGGVLLSVEDEGPGIPDETKAVMFEAFRQGDQARASGSGAGIGLSLVRAFAELHGGRVWVEDRSDRPGTAFRVLLPGEAVEPEPVGRGEAPASVRV